MRIEMAKKVIEHLDKFPFGFPRSTDKDEWRLLEMPFVVSDEEGEVLSQLMPFKEHIDDIAIRIGRDKSELIPILDSLVHKCWALRDGSKGAHYYRALNWGPVHVELAIAQLSDEYYNYWAHQTATPETIAAVYGNAGVTPWVRVIPREAAIPYNSEVLPAELLSHLIDHAGDEGLAICDCICRTKQKRLGAGCDAPRDTCIFVGSYANNAVEIGVASAITKDEALKISRRAQDAGLIHQGTASEHGIFICSCCACCCSPLKLMMAGVNSILKSNFIADVNVELCNGCRDCIKACRLKFVTINRTTKKAAIDLEKCIGCGLCVLACTHGAVTLKRKEKDKIIDLPHTWDDYMRLRATERGKMEFYK